MKSKEPKPIEHDVLEFNLPSQAEILYRQCQDKIGSAKESWRDKKGIVTISGYIWGELAISNDITFDAETWHRLFQKRVNCILEVDKRNPMYKAELRKRVLQQAALSICALKVIDKL